MKMTKTQLYLMLIFIIAFVVRIIAAYHTHVSTDEMLYTILPLNIITAGRLGVIEQSPVFFYLTDLGYKLLGGINAISIRSTAILFGALAVFVIYLLSIELFKDKKIGLLSAFLFAFSGFSLFNNYEMNMAAFFFGLLSMLFFVQALKGDPKNIYFASLFLTLGVLIKSIVLILVPVYAFAWLIHCYKRKLLFTRADGDILINTKTITTILIGTFIALSLFSPVLIYNYFIYQEQGFTDNYLSQFFGIGELSHDYLKSKPWEFSRLLVVTKSIFKELLQMDAILLLFGIAGIILTVIKRNDLSSVLVLSLLLLFLIVGGRTGSSPHFLWATIVFSIFAGYSSYQSARWVKSKFKFQHFIVFIVIIILVNSFIVMQKIVQQRENSITLKLREYVSENIPDHGIVIIDPRIYSGIHAWVFHDKHYLDGAYFDEFILALDNISGTELEVPFYYFECGPGTKCGWNAEEFEKVSNQSQRLSNSLYEVMTKVDEVKAIDHINVYEGTLTMPISAYGVIDRAHAFWRYPVGWHYPELAFDNYHTTGIGSFFNFCGFVFLYFDVVLALLAVPFVVMLVFQKEEDEKPEQNSKAEQTTKTLAESLSPETLKTEYPQPFYTEPSVEKNDEQPR